MGNLVCPSCGGDLKRNSDGTLQCIYCGAQVSVKPEENNCPNHSFYTKSQVGVQKETGVDRFIPFNVRHEYSAPQNKTEENISVFAKSDWEYFWKVQAQKDKGIILTDTSNLVNKENFIYAVKKFIAFKRQKGVYYEFLDLACQTVIKDFKIGVNQIVELLKRIYSASIPKYLLIVGDWKVIPCALWDNETGDDDEFVPSDFVYTSLDCDSPWSGKEYDLDNVTRVGRVPTSATNSFIEAVKYFNNVINFKPVSKINGFAYSAHVWTKTSKEVFGSISENLYISPKYLCEPRDDYKDGILLPRLDNYNLLGFNLHGSESTNYWYGQKGDFLPEAFMSSLLPSKELGAYIVCAEACYGAKPTVSKNNADSILLTALQNNCMAFVGSSMIAYGQSDGSLSCADIIACDFLNSVKNGYDVGTAFNMSLVHILKNIESEEDIKTLAEFALYGDPSIVFSEVQTIKKVAYSLVDLKVAKTNRNNTLVRKLIPISDTLGFYDKKYKTCANFSYNESENLAIKKTAYVINRKSCDYINGNYDNLKDIVPIIYKVIGCNEYRSVYTKTIGGIKAVIKLHLNENGDVLKTYISK